MKPLPSPRIPADDARYAGRRLRVDCESFSRSAGTFGWTGPGEVASFVPRLARLISWADSACFSDVQDLTASLELRSWLPKTPDLEKEFPPELFGIPVSKTVDSKARNGKPTLSAAASFTAVVSVPSVPLLVRLLTPEGSAGTWREPNSGPPAERLFMELSDPESGAVVGWLGTDEPFGWAGTEKPETWLLPCFVPAAQRLRLWSSFGCAPEKLTAYGVPASPALAALRERGVQPPNYKEVKALEKEVRRENEAGE